LRLLEKKGPGAMTGPLALVYSRYGIEMRHHTTGCG
jgi:hypothetical protein